MPTYASCSRSTPLVHSLYDSWQLRCSRIKEWRAEDEAKKKRLEENLLCLPGLCSVGWRVAWILVFRIYLCWRLRKPSNDLPSFCQWAACSKGYRLSVTTEEDNDCRRSIIITFPVKKASRLCQNKFKRVYMFNYNGLQWLSITNINIWFVHVYIYICIAKQMKNACIIISTFVKPLTVTRCKTIAFWRKWEVLASPLNPAGA